MKKVWFENSNGVERVIGGADNWQSVNRIIDNFIAEANGRKPPNAPEFKRHYTRYWQQDDGRLRIDVGSHTEFFIWEGYLNN